MTIKATMNLKTAFLMGQAYNKFLRGDDMDREKIIKALECCCESDSFDKPNCKDCPAECISGYMSIPFIQKVLALLKEQEWNLLTEDDEGIIHGLPGDDGQYLMTDGREIWIDDYMDGVDDGIFLDSGRDVREIKAWMYMPELPKQEGR